MKITHGEIPIGDAIIDAIQAGDAEAVARLATHQTVDATGPGGVTPLMLAPRLGHSEIVATLRAAGAVVDAPDERGFTALFHGSPTTPQHCVRQERSSDEGAA
jgi:ankyrin repeat protein